MGFLSSLFNKPQPARSTTNQPEKSTKFAWPTRLTQLPNALRGEGKEETLWLLTRDAELVRSLIGNQVDVLIVPQGGRLMVYLNGDMVGQLHMFAEEVLSAWLSSLKRGNYGLHGTITHASIGPKGGNISVAVTFRKPSRKQMQALGLM